MGDATRSFVLGMASFLSGVLLSFLIPIRPRSAEYHPIVLPEGGVPSLRGESLELDALKEQAVSQEKRIAELKVESARLSDPPKVAATPAELKARSERVAELWVRSYREKLSKEEDAELMRLYAEIDADMAPYLIEYYRTKAIGDPQKVTSMLVMLLAEVGGPEVAALLAERLTDETGSEDEKRRILWELGSSTDTYRTLDKNPTTPELGELARTYVTSSEPDVRGAGARLLGGIPGPESRATLTSLLTDANWSIRSVAFLSLGRIGDRSTLTLLQGIRQSREGSWVDSNASRSERQALERAIRKLRSRLDP